MSLRLEHLPLPGLLLPLLTTVLLLSAAAGTSDHLVLGLALAGMAALTATTHAAPVGARVVSVRSRSEVCRATGVRASDPDRPGHARPRAPGRR